MQGNVYQCETHGASECWKVEYRGGVGRMVHLRCGCSLSDGAAREQESVEPVTLTVKPNAVFPVDVTTKKTLKVSKRRR